MAITRGSAKAKDQQQPTTLPLPSASASAAAEINSDLNTNIEKQSQQQQQQQQQEQEQEQQQPQCSIAAETISDYEQTRELRIKENRERLQKLGIVDLSLQLKSVVKPTPKRKYERKTPLKPPSVGSPQSIRRSSRLQNAPPVTYTEHKEEKSKRSRDIVLEEGAKLEFYTEEDEKLLGNTEMPWTFFVDGYRKDGTRIYDLVNGKTCDQCRQKTLGQRTRCFKCNLVQGQFCGDCLFMRYGEHVVEAKQNPEWVCPPCRGICNCSLCRQAKGWAPTGALYRKVIGLGFRSVAHYLVSTKCAPPEPDKSLSNAPQPAKRSLPFEGMELHKDDNGCNIKAAVKRTKINPQSERHNQT